MSDPLRFRMYAILRIEPLANNVDKLIGYKILHTNAIQSSYQSCDRDIHGSRHFIRV